jgi:hypothetical protein
VIVFLIMLLVAGSGALGLIARSRVPYKPPLRQLVNSVFRLVAGLALAGWLLLSH